MSNIDSLLDDVEQLIHDVKPAEAEQKLLSFMSSVGDREELTHWEPDLRQTFSRFQKKRRKLLNDHLDSLLHRDPAAVQPASSEVKLSSPPGLQTLKLAMAEDLRDLSDRHIFQWSTYYRDRLEDIYDSYESPLSKYENRSEALADIRLEFRAHSFEIFTKGVTHTKLSQGAASDAVLVKSRSGLQRFIDVPVGLLSNRTSQGGKTNADYLLARQVTSAMLAGILEGFCDTRFVVDATEFGSDVLTSDPEFWIHSVGFIEHDQLDEIASLLPDGWVRRGIFDSAVPAALAVDRAMRAASQSSSAYAPLPVLCQYRRLSRRVEIECLPPPASAGQSTISLHCVMDPSTMDVDLFREAANRDVAAVIGAFPRDIANAVSSETRLESRAINVEDFSSLEDTAIQIERRISLAVSRRAHSADDAPLEWNFAAEFPLQTARMARHFMVHRTSVRELLNTFEKRSGVRLWCSVRRSGKTTACLDLGATTGSSRVISQTCLPQGKLPDEDLFYTRVTEAIDNMKSLPNDFFMNVLEECGASSIGGDRIVFVLDEYETLFRRLQTASRANESVRYTVAQPLLNQMTVFTRDNLLVFLGQEPDAHYIFMDQNQLSPYVQQDSFPLFQYKSGSRNSEFPSLLEKVLTEQVEFDETFVRAVHEETGGHPYLTVSVLVDFVEWLISVGRKRNELSFTASDFQRFSRERLTAKHISQSSNYQFFSFAASEARSEHSRDQRPWLFAIYSGLAFLMREKSSPTLRSVRRDFIAFIDELGLEDSGIRADSLLRSGAMSNFFAFDDHYVWPRIPLLGRIAAASKPAVIG